MRMTIGQVAAASGFSASTIRYYEQTGILPKPIRVSGRRQYDREVLEQLAIVERTKACGFSLEETRQLFRGFREDVAAPERWQVLGDRKRAGLDELVRRINAMRRSLELTCACQDLAECGRRILEKKRATRE